MEIKSVLSVLITCGEDGDYPLGPHQYSEIVLRLPSKVDLEWASDLR